jgi:gliding motility associated protien GldN
MSMKSQQSFWKAYTVAFAALAFVMASSPTLSAQTTPLDDFTERSIVPERPVLAYPTVREADILWEKRIWRVLDVREKINLPFAAPDAPLFDILRKAVSSGELTAYSTDDDKFGRALSVAEVMSKITRTDTILDYWTADDAEPETKVIFNEINWEDIKRFRLKEAWFFDARTSTLQVRILGIAPLMDVRDEEGNFRYEMPLFWIHYPSAREVLAQHKVVLNGSNLATATTWEDLLERRQFASSILKENNVQDIRLTDVYTGLDVPVQGQKISDGIFNFEHDLWSW